MARATNEPWCLWLKSECTFSEQYFLYFRKNHVSNIYPRVIEKAQWMRCACLMLQLRFQEFYLAIRKSINENMEKTIIRKHKNVLKKTKILSIRFAHVIWIDYSLLWYWDHSIIILKSKRKNFSHCMNAVLLASRGRHRITFEPISRLENAFWKVNVRIAVFIYSHAVESMSERAHISWLCYHTNYYTTSLCHNFWDDLASRKWQTVGIKWKKIHSHMIWIWK